MVLGADYLNNKKEAHYLFEIKCIAILWAILVIVFLPYWSSFFLGNHDFRFMRYGIPIDAGVFEGRFTQFVVPWLLSSGQILPIWNIFLGFAFYAWAIVRGLLWLGLPKKSFEVVAIGLVIGLNPYILMSSGSMMIATDDGYGLVRKLNQAGIEASVIGKATDKNERILRNGEETRYMDKPQSDELYKIYQ